MFELLEFLSRKLGPNDYFTKMKHSSCWCIGPWIKLNSFFLHNSYHSKPYSRKMHFMAIFHHLSKVNFEIFSWKTFNLIWKGKHFRFSVGYNKLKQKNYFQIKWRAKYIWNLLGFTGNIDLKRKSNIPFDHFQQGNCKIGDWALGCNLSILFSSTRIP